MLARGAFVTAQSMLGIVANLEQIGLIKREAHPTHGRIRRSKLTERGSAVLAKAHAVLSDIDETMTSGFNNKERKLLRCLLEKCAENFVGKPGYYRVDLSRYFFEPAES